MKYWDRARQGLKNNKRLSRPLVLEKPEFLPEDEYINKIIEGDCLEKLKGIPDNSVDVIITDPPYGMGKDTWDDKVVPPEMWKEVFSVNCLLK